MSQSSVISDVSRTLQMLLETKLAPDKTIKVTVTSPKTVKLVKEHQLNLYLCQVVENPFVKNREPIRVGYDRLRQPPLALNLYYLLTPYIKNEEDNRDEHLLLGQAMRILYEHSILTDPFLEGELKGSGEEIKIVLCSMNLEELTRIWNSLQMSYRLSVYYEVRVLLVDSTREWEVHRVATKETLYHQLKSSV